MPTTWNLNRQCVNPFKVANNALQKALSILEMHGGRKNSQALTQSEVLEFVGWSPFHTCEQFDQYSAKHPELEPMPPMDHAFRTSEHIAEAGDSD